MSTIPNFSEETTDAGIGDTSHATFWKTSTGAMIRATWANLKAFILTYVEANVSEAVVKTKYEANADTNAFTDAEKTKVGHISVTQTVDLDAIETNSDASKVKTDHLTVTGAVDLDAIEAGATADQTGAEIKTALEGELTGDVADTGSAQTLTNKRVQARVNTTASGSSVTPDISSYDVYEFTALTETLTINAPTGTPVNFESLTFRILDDGGGETLTFNSAYAFFDTNPGTTTASKWIYFNCFWNPTSSKWDTFVIEQP